MKLLLHIGVVCVCACYIALSIQAEDTKSPRKPDFKFTVPGFYQAIPADEKLAAKKFAGKVIEVTGVCEDISRAAAEGSSTIVLHDDRDPDASRGVFTDLNEKQPWAKIVPGQRVTIRASFSESAVRSEAGQKVGYIYLKDGTIVDAGKYLGISITAAELAKLYKGDPKATAKKYDGKYLLMTGDFEKWEDGAPPYLYVKADGVRMRMQISILYKETLQGLIPGKTIKMVSPVHFDKSSRDEIFFGITHFVD